MTAAISGQVKSAGERPLIDREPFTADYETARRLLASHFRFGHTAQTLLGLYRDGLIDLAVVEIDHGAATESRVVIRSTREFPNQSEPGSLNGPDEPVSVPPTACAQA